MKIRDKRSVYFYLADGFTAAYPNLYFAYIDETPGGVGGVLYEGLTPDCGVRIFDNIVLKIDAERPFLLFTGAQHGAAPSIPKINSKLGATYSAGQTGGSIGGGGSAALIIPGLKCGDFVEIAKQ